MCVGLCPVCVCVSRSGTYKSYQSYLAYLLYVCCLALSCLILPYLVLACLILSFLRYLSYLSTVPTCLPPFLSDWLSVCILRLNFLIPSHTHPQIYLQYIDPPLYPPYISQLASHHLSTVPKGMQRITRIYFGLDTLKHVESYAQSRIHQIVWSRFTSR